MGLRIFLPLLGTNAAICRGRMRCQAARCIPLKAPLARPSSHILHATCRERMTEAFKGLSRPCSSSATLLAAVGEVVAGGSALQREAAPQAVHKAFTQVAPW